MLFGIFFFLPVVREESGPYSDPQHPYFYEEEDVWMAPGFINQFYEASWIPSSVVFPLGHATNQEMNMFILQVPDYWKTYVHEIDREREIWLNSFYKSPLRIPMPAELEHWWEKGITPLSLFLSHTHTHTHNGNFTSHSGFRLARGLHMICKPIRLLHFSCTRTFSFCYSVSGIISRFLLLFISFSFFS